MGTLVLGAGGAAMAALSATDPWRQRRHHRRFNWLIQLKHQMSCNARCSRLQHAVLAIATLSLSGCVTVSFDRPPPARHAACPPEVTYSAGEQAQVAEELERLPEDAALLE